MKGIVKSTFRILINAALYLFILLPVYSQKAEDRSALEKRKTETIQQIEYTKKLLNNTRQSAEVTVNQINLLNRNISNREKLINELDNEILIFERQIELNTMHIVETEKTIELLKEEYEKFIVAAYKNMDHESSLEYILGAEDINQGYQRLKQIKYINEYRKKIYKDLIDKKSELSEQNKILEQSLKELEKAKSVKSNELGLLGREKSDKARTVSKLKQEERKLLSEFKKQQSIQNRLENEIKKLIEAEILRAKEKNVAMLTPAEKIISDEFSKNMGGLPWPVEKGIITVHFGEHDHPVIKGIKQTSIGIDINTDQGESARCVFDGEVTKVIAILGANYTVLIKHGEFYSVYKNLINIKVKVGDKVKKNEAIGTIYTDKNNSARLHFQIWKGKVLQDPEKWLAK